MSFASVLQSQMLGSAGPSVSGMNVSAANLGGGTTAKMPDGLEQQLIDIFGWEDGLANFDDSGGWNGMHSRTISQEQASQLIPLLQQLPGAKVHTDSHWGVGQLGTPAGGYDAFSDPATRPQATNDPRSVSAYSDGKDYMLTLPGGQGVRLSYQPEVVGSEGTIGRPAEYKIEYVQNANGWNTAMGQHNGEEDPWGDVVLAGILTVAGAYAMPQVGAAAASATGMQAGTWGAALVSGAAQGAIMGGVGAAITGGDIGQGILGGALTGGITGAASNLISTPISNSLTSTVGKNAADIIGNTAGKVVGTTVSGMVQGQDAGDALTSGLISGASSAAGGATTVAVGGNPSQGSIAGTFASSLTSNILRGAIQNDSPTTYSSGTGTGGGSSVTTETPQTVQPGGMMNFGWMSQGARR